MNNFYASKFYNLNEINISLEKRKLGFTDSGTPEY